MAVHSYRPHRLSFNRRHGAFCWLAVLLWMFFVIGESTFPPPVLAQLLTNQRKAARSGDVIHVPAGVHNVSLNVGGGVTLEGLPGAIIDAMDR